MTKKTNMMPLLAGITGIAGAVGIYFAMKSSETLPIGETVTVYDSYGDDYTGTLISINPDGSMNIDTNDDGITDITGWITYTPPPETVTVYDSYGNAYTGYLISINPDGSMNVDLDGDGEADITGTAIYSPIETWITVNMERPSLIKLPIGSKIRGSSPNPAYNGYEWIIQNVSHDSWGFYYEGNHDSIIEPMSTITEVVKETAFMKLNILTTAQGSGFEIMDNLYGVILYTGTAPTLIMIAPGNYTIFYSDVAGFIKPANHNLTVDAVNPSIERYEVTAEYIPTPNVMNSGNAGLFAGSDKTSLLIEIQKKHPSAYYFDDFVDNTINTSKWTKTTYSNYHGYVGVPAAMGANGSVTESEGYIQVYSGGESLQSYNAYDSASASLSSVNTPDISTVNYIAFRIYMRSYSNAGANSSFSIGGYGAGYGGVGSIDYIIELLRNGTTFDVYQNGVYQNNISMSSTAISGYSASIFGTSVGIYYVIFG